MICNGHYPRRVQRLEVGQEVRAVRLPKWRAVVVAGESMTPLLRPGDCLLVRAGVQIRAGDVVLARRPATGLNPDATGPRLLLVKRAVRRAEAGWWLASDNAELGLDDSRAFGAVPDHDIVGRVVMRYYPWHYSWHYPWRRARWRSR